MLLNPRGKDFGDPVRNRIPGDIIVLKTVEQVRSKFSEMLQSGTLTQEIVDDYTDIHKKIRRIVPQDFLDADCRWPWGEGERKNFLIIYAELTDEQIADLEGPDGYIDGTGKDIHFVATAHRKKNFKFDSIKLVTALERILDPEDDYQPLENYLIDHSYIETLRDGNIEE